MSPFLQPTAGAERRGERRDDIRESWFSRNARGEGERDAVCEVRQVRVPYFPRESRGLGRMSLGVVGGGAGNSPSGVQVAGLGGGRADGFGYASPRPGWICRRHLLPGRREEGEKVRNSLGKEGIRRHYLPPLEQLWKRPKRDVNFFAVSYSPSKGQRESRVREKRQLHWLQCVTVLEFDYFVFLFFFFNISSREVCKRKSIIKEVNNN